jgi:hypothetical protein
MRGLLSLLAGLLLLAPAAMADVPADPGWTGAEAWAWQQIAAGRPADFDAQCHASPDPKSDDAAWSDPCRTVRGTMLEQILTRPPWRDALRHQGLRMAGVRLPGGLDLTNAHVASAVILTRSRIEGDVLLARTRLDSLFALDGSVITGAIEGTGLLTESDFSLSDGRQLVPSPGSIGAVEAHGTVTLRNARIKGSVFLNASHFQQVVDVRGAHIDEDFQTSGAKFEADAQKRSVWGGSMLIGGKLSINATQFAGNVLFPDSTIGGLVDASDSKFGGTLNLVDSHVAGDVFLDKVQSTGAITIYGLQVGGYVSLTHAHCSGPLQAFNARVAGDISVKDSQFDAPVTLAGLHLAGSLRIATTPFKSRVSLRSAVVAGDVQISAADFSGDLDMLGLHADGDITLAGTFGPTVGLSGARIAGDLDLTGASLGRLDLSGAAIDGSLEVGPKTTWRPPASADEPQLLLVNTKVGALQDGAVGTFDTCPTDETPAKANGWPAGRTTKLDGFSYGHLASSAGSEGADMRDRPVCWWRWWLERDPEFSTQPYVQLASVMATHGDQEKAAAIQYYGRVRETQLAWQAGHYGRWMLLAALNVVTGYGIGSYTFRVLGWIVALMVLGIVLLKWSPGGGQKPLLWRTGASLGRVLPGVEINKEFSDFFDDPQRQRLKDWQVFVFSAFVIIGWVLGLFLVAAMTGLTQHS